MVRRSLALSLLLAASCGKQPEAAPAKQQARPEPQAQAEGLAAAAPAQKGELPRAVQGDPAAVLRRYYGLIEAGDYEGAWRMRSGERAGLERFSANFRSYERYHAAVGQPTEAVEAGGWAYVEIPVMITGRIRGGEPFASSGSITLRRATDAPDATARERDWHIYTGG